MFNECRHIKTDGYKCHSPALSGRAYCYHHFKLTYRGKSMKVRELTTPIASINDLRGVQLAINQVLASFQSPYCDVRRAGVFLHGLNLAAQVIKQLPKTTPKKKSVKTANESLPRK